MAIRDESSLGQFTKSTLLATAPSPNRIGLGINTPIIGWVLAAFNVSKRPNDRNTHVLFLIDRVVVNRLLFVFNYKGTSTSSL